MFEFWDFSRLDLRRFLQPESNSPRVIVAMRGHLENVAMWRRCSTTSCIQYVPRISFSGLGVSPRQEKLSWLRPGMPRISELESPLMRIQRWLQVVGTMKFVGITQGLFMPEIGCRDGIYACFFL